MENYYRQLASYYQYQYFKRVSLSKRILSARVAVLGLVAELKSFVVKKGETKKTQERLDFYNEIFDTLDEADRLESENYSLVQLANKAISDRDLYKAKCEALERQIKDLNKFLK